MLFEAEEANNVEKHKDNEEFRVSRQANALKNLRNMNSLGVQSMGVLARSPHNFLAGPRRWDPRNLLLGVWW